jgi:hypothetical protein
VSATEEAQPAGFELRFNFWLSDASAVCQICGEEHLVTWTDDTPPDETALRMWAWLRDHAESHWLDQEVP